MTSPLMVLTRISPSSFFTMSSAFLASFKMTNSLELNLSSDRFLTPSRIAGFLPGSGGKLGGRSNVTLWVPFPLGCVVAALFPLGCDAAVALLPPSSFPSLVQQLLLSLRLKPCSLFTSTSNLLTATETLLLLLLLDLFLCDTSLSYSLPHQFHLWLNRHDSFIQSSSIQW